MENQILFKDTLSIPKQAKIVKFHNEAVIGAH